MRLWLIRHAQAVDRDAFGGSDLERPLTEKGIQRSRRSFSKLAGLYPSPDLVISSEAVRAWETARIFCEAYGINDFGKTRLLNPGCSFKDIRNVVEAVPPDISSIALFGHEPDFSNAASQWVSNGALNINLKKGSLVELNISKSGTVSLVMSIPPKILADS